MEGYVVGLGISMVIIFLLTCAGFGFCFGALSGLKKKIQWELNGVRSEIRHDTKYLSVDIDHIKKELLNLKIEIKEIEETGEQNRKQIQENAREYRDSYFIMSTKVDILDKEYKDSYMILYKRLEVLEDELKKPLKRINVLNRGIEKIHKDRKKFRETILKELKNDITELLKPKNEC